MAHGASVVFGESCSGPVADQLLTELLNDAAPSEAIGRTFDAAHAHAVIFGIAARVSGDDYVIAGFQGIARNAVATQLAAATPFNGPGNHLALFIRSFHVDERVR